jgi:hypothetical protein
VAHSTILNAAATVRIRILSACDDGVVEWQYGKSDKEELHSQVSGTHVGLAFNPSVYTLIANRLAHARCAPRKRGSKLVALRHAAV